MKIKKIKPIKLTARQKELTKKRLNNYLHNLELIYSHGKPYTYCDGICHHLNTSRNHALAQHFEEFMSVPESMVNYGYFLSNHALIDNFGVSSEKAILASIMARTIAVTLFMEHLGISDE